ncbi:trigger factor [Clostridium sp. CAG:1024]|mgnify:FL=1|jgi:trigger factor|nr:trigger factor [Clostridium sp. CAG:1024]
MATIEKLEHDQVKLTIEIDADTFNAALQQAYVKNGKHYNIAGFRKGKAPRKVIESMYGEGVFFEDAFELCWGDAYDAALEENGLTAVDKPTLDIEKIGKDEGVVFTAVVQLKPTVKLGAYKGIEVEQPTYTVEDADVNAEIEKEREKNARFVDVERAVENGDRVVIDYSGSVDGVQFDGGTAEEQTLVIGSNTFIPGFEEQLIGMNVGEERDITVTFPEEYHAENLAGKEAVFHIKLHNVQFKELPELDDEFAKDVSEFDTLAELIADKRKKMEEQAAKNEKIAIENIALKTVCDNAEVEVPECMTERQANYMLRDMGYRLQMSGISLEDYCRYVGTDLNALKASYHDEAASRVKMQLVIEAVGKAENVTCTDEEIAEVIKEYAENNDMPVEEFEKQISDDDREFLSDRKIAEKTVALIVDNVKLVPAKKTEEK